MSATSGDCLCALRHGVVDGAAGSHDVEVLTNGEQPAQALSRQVRRISDQNADLPAAIRRLPRRASSLKPRPG